MGRHTMHVTLLQPSRPCECSGSHCLYLPCAEQRNGQRKGRVAPQFIIVNRDLGCQVRGRRRAMVDMTAGQAFGRPLARQGASDLEARSGWIANGQSFAPCSAAKTLDICEHLCYNSVTHGPGCRALSPRPEAGSGKDPRADLWPLGVQVSWPKKGRVHYVRR